MRKLVAYFIKYQVAVNIFVLAFFLFGIFGAKALKSSFFPLTESKIIQISIAYPGASPLEIEEGVVLKIEDNLKGLQGVDRVTAVANENSGRITVEIEKGLDIDFMLLEVKNAVDRVPSYPTGMEPLVVAKQEVVRPTISLALSGKNVPLQTLKQLGRGIENDIRAMEGISQITVSGYPQEEIEIAVNESQLLAYNLSFTEVAQAVANANLLITGGTVKTAEEDFLIRANNKYYFGKELSNLIVTTQSNGTLVRLSEVAEIRDRFAESPNATFYDGEEAVNITINSTNTEDLISTATRIKEYALQYNQTHDGVHLSVLSDQSITLTQRTELLVKNAWQGMLLVLFFLSLFLNTRLAFWVAFGLPVAFMGMFAFAGFFNVTINVLSLFGMIIVIGILAGFLAGRLMKGKGFGLLMNLIIGVGGAILGGWLFGALGLSFGGGVIGALITAFLGAIILLYIINLIKMQPDPRFFYKTFLELGGANFCSILSFDSLSMESLLSDENDQYFSEEYPIIYKNKMIKKDGSGYYYTNSIDNAIKNN